LLRRESASGPPPFEVYKLVGPDALNATSMAAIWADVLHRPIRYVSDDLDAFEARLKAFEPQRYAYDIRLTMRRYQLDGAVASSARLERFMSLLGRMPRRRGRINDKRSGRLNRRTAVRLSRGNGRTSSDDAANGTYRCAGGSTLGYSAFAQSG
jgi:hypothetical protein